MKTPNTFSAFLRRAGGAMALAASLGAAAQAQPLPAEGPIRLIVPLTPGSLVDSVARAMSEDVAKVAGRPVVVENIPGAGNIIGTSQMVRSKPDGLTLAMVSSNHVINPSLYKSIPFDSLKDISPISVVGTSTMVLAVNNDVKAKTPAELVALMKAAPGRLNMGSSGNGTTLHLAGEMLLKQAGVKAEHIPFSGQGPLLTSLMGGQVDFGFVAVATGTPLFQAGKLRALAVSGKTRSPVLPDLPTLAESGYPEYDLDSWVAVIGPPGLPAETVDYLHKTFKQALASAKVASTFASQGILPLGSTPAETSAYFQSEYDKYAALIKSLGIEPN